MRANSPADYEWVRDSPRAIAAMGPRNIGESRDRAILALIAYAHASPEAIIQMRVKDYYHLADRFWVSLAQYNRTVRHQQVRPKLKMCLDEYLAAAQIEGEMETPLFRSINGRRISARGIDFAIMLDAIKRIGDKEDLTRVIRRIPPKGVYNLRDRAILGLLLYTPLTAVAISRMRVEDYVAGPYQNTISIKREKLIVLPKEAAQLLDRYLIAVRSRTHQRSFLFRSDGIRRITASDIRGIVDTRCTEAGHVPRSKGGRRPALRRNPAVGTEPGGAHGRFIV